MSSSVDQGLVAGFSGLLPPTSDLSGLLWSSSTPTQSSVLAPKCKRPFSLHLGVPPEDSHSAAFPGVPAEGSWAQAASSPSSPTTLSQDPGWLGALASGCSDTDTSQPETTSGRQKTPSRPHTKFKFQAHKAPMSGHTGSSVGSPAQAPGPEQLHSWPPLGPCPHTQGAVSLLLGG